MKNLWFFFLFAMFVLTLGCGRGNAAPGAKTTLPGGGNVTADTRVIDIINHPAFEGFGRFVLPTERGMPRAEMRLDEIGSLLPFHSNINVETTIKAINYMLNEANSAKTIFYAIYTDEEKRSAPAKENTGLFFFRGRPNAPFAIVCAGGGWSYVGSIHEGFPFAIQLVEGGYNAFVIQYRTGGASVACEDLAAAISFIFANAEELEVSTEGYSLWGSSAGARMAAYLGSHGSAAFGGEDLPRAGTVVMLYTGHTEYTENDPPTFAVIGENDGIASWRTMERRINALKVAGIDAEFHKYPNLGHGYGLGIGTSAEGWLSNAVAFWEKHLNK